MQKNRGDREKIEFLELFIFNKLGLNSPILVANTIESFENPIWQRLYNIESCSRWWGIPGCKILWVIFQSLIK